MASSRLSFSQARSQPSKKCLKAARLLQTGQFPATTEAYSQILELSPGNEAVTLGLAAA
jgi:hypothetical protein